MYLEESTRQWNEFKKMFPPISRCFIIETQTAFCIMSYAPVEYRLKYDEKRFIINRTGDKDMKRILKEDIERVIICVENLNRCAEDNIAGDIYFQIGTEFFPYENYTYYPVIILSSWIEEVYQLCYSDNCRFSFLCDPYSIEFKKIDSELLQMRCCSLESRPYNHWGTDYEFVISRKKLVHAVFRASGRLLMELESFGEAKDNKVQELKMTMY